MDDLWVLKDRVIFRERKGEVIALFPDTERDGMVDYASLSGRGRCKYTTIMRGSEPTERCGQLLRGLTEEGMDLRIKMRK
jgi:hypothetical protein